LGRRSHFYQNINYLIISFKRRSDEAEFPPALFVLPWFEFLLVEFPFDQVVQKIELVFLGILLLGLLVPEFSLLFYLIELGS